MPDQVTRTTRRSWGSRIQGSIASVFVGLLLFAGGLILLFSNEGRAVRRHKALAQGAREVVSVAANLVDAANEGRVVHVTGRADTDETLTDPVFGVAARAIHLERSVEMYQWTESESRSTKKKVGGSTETVTTYSYQKAWSDSLIDSSRFEVPAGHRNPTQMPLESRRVSARNVTLGGFRLADSLVQRLDQWSAARPETAGSQRNARLVDGGVYVGSDPAAPRVGDVRVSFRQVEPATVTVVAGQSGALLSRYPTRSGGSIELLRYGTAGADEMFSAARRANKILTWILRVAGFLLLAFGLGMVLGPLPVLADVVPAIGRVVRAGRGAVAIGCALPVALLTISAAWLLYRPLLALAIIVPAVFLIVVTARRARRDRSPTPVAPPPPPAPAPG